MTREWYNRNVSSRHCEFDSVARILKSRLAMHSHWGGILALRNQLLIPKNPNVEILAKADRVFG